MKIINIGVLAHVDAGKTTLTEQLLYRAGATRAAGSVDTGTAQTDFLPVERERGISVKTSGATLTYQGVQCNLIDTPGHVDFAAEVERALAALDIGVLVISAAEGVQSRTELLFEALQRTHTSTVLFINKVDRTGSSVENTLSEIREKLSDKLLLFSQVTHEGDRSCSVTPRSLTDPAFFEEAAEGVADGDETVMEAYLNGTLTVEGLRAGLKRCLAQGSVVPVLCGSATLDVGVEDLLAFLTEYGTPVKNREDDTLSGIVYRVTHDKTMGRLAHVRLYGGNVKNRDAIRLQRLEEPQKITQIRRYQGGKFEDLGQLAKGDIAALCGLSQAQVGDIIGEVNHLYGYTLSTPLFRVHAATPDEADRFALIRAFQELAAEDPQLDLQYVTTERELDINITGLVQLEILEAILRQRYGLQVLFSAPTVIYRETPLQKGRGFEAYIMPKPCWAVVELEVEPRPAGSGLSFSSVVPNVEMFYRYQHHVETSVGRALKQGNYNWEVVDLHVTLVGGEHHTVHTHPMDFFLATPIAVMRALQDAGTALLEPMQQVRLTADESLSGKLIGDIIAMRGSYDSPIIHKGTVSIEAMLPVATSMDYSVRLASISGGKGTLSSRFAGYQPCPVELGAMGRRLGVHPLDRDKWILTMRNAMREAL